MGDTISCINDENISTVASSTTSKMSLTLDQRKEIQKTWAIPAADPEGSGAVILHAFFEKYPKNQEKFVSFKNKPLSELKVSVKIIQFFVTFGFVASYLYVGINSSIKLE